MVLWAIRRMQRPESLLNLTYRHNTSSLSVRVQSSKNRDMAIRWKQNWKPCFYLLLHFSRSVVLINISLILRKCHLKFWCDIYKRVSSYRCLILTVLSSQISVLKSDITQSIHCLRDIKTETTEKSCYLETLNTRNDTVWVTRVTSK